MGCTSAKCSKNPKLLGCHKRRNCGTTYITAHVQFADPTNSSNTTRCCLASHRASSLDKEEQHCPWCDTRKNKFSNMARICKSCDSRYPMDCLGNQIWQSRGGHYLSPSSELVQSTHDGLHVTATQNPNFQENYVQIWANSHSQLLEDIATFIFCSSLPSSYQDLTSQYLTSIKDITKYSLQKIIARVIEEES